MNRLYAKPFRVEYENDTGPHDAYFVEWWAVLDANNVQIARADELPEYDPAIWPHKEPAE